MLRLLRPHLRSCVTKIRLYSLKNPEQVLPRRHEDTESRTGENSDSDRRETSREPSARNLCSSAFICGLNFPGVFPNKVPTCKALYPTDCQAPECNALGFCVLDSGAFFVFTIEKKDVFGDLPQEKEMNMDLSIKDYLIQRNVSALIAVGRLDRAIEAARMIENEDIRVEMLRAIVQAVVRSNHYGHAVQRVSIEEDTTPSIQALLMVVVVVAQTLQGHHSSATEYMMSVILDEVIAAVSEVPSLWLQNALFMAVAQVIRLVMIDNDDVQPMEHKERKELLTMQRCSPDKRWKREYANVDSVA